MLPDDALLELQVRTLFRFDDRGRLLSTNEADPPPPAPRFFFGRTRLGHVARYRYDLPDEGVRALRRLVALEPAGAALAGEPPAVYAAVRAVLEEHGPVHDEWRGPAFRFPEGGVADRVAGDVSLVALTAPNAVVLEGEFAWLRRWLADVQPCVAAVVGGQVVAVCHASRRTTEAAEAGVATLPGFWGRGYGAAVVTAWAGAVRAAGLLPLYSTSWDNVASRALARRLGLVQYAEDFQIT